MRGGRLAIKLNPAVARAYKRFMQMCQENSTAYKMLKEHEHEVLANATEVDQEFCCYCNHKEPDKVALPHWSPFKLTRLNGSRMCHSDCEAAMLYTRVSEG